MENGKYVLPDRRIVIKTDDLIIVLGHRNKKRLRMMSKQDVSALKRLAVAQKVKLPKDASQDEIARLLIPRPRAVASWTWLNTSENPDALELKALLLTVQPFIDESNESID